MADGVVADDGAGLATAVGCFMDDFEACIAHLRLPIGHRRATRTTNLLERLLVEERRRLKKIIPNAFGERAVLKLVFGAMTRAAERRRSLRITAFERRQMAALRQELDHDEAAVGLDPSRSNRGPRHQNSQRLSDLTGSKAKPRLGGSKPVIRDEVEATLVHPVEAETGARASPAMLRRVLRRLGLPRKDTLRAAERDTRRPWRKRPRIGARRSRA